MTTKKIKKTSGAKSPVKNPYRLYTPNIITTASGRKLHRTGTAINNMGSSTGGGSQSVAQAPLYYDYRWSTPDKYYFPRNRVVANAIWREVYKRDAVIGVATDMYSELPWSDFDIIGVDDNNVKHVYEDMFSELKLVPKLPLYTKSFLVTGESILHSIFDSRKGYWIKIIPHNSDYINVIGAGLATTEPLLYLRPTPEIKKLINSNDPRVRKLQKLIPAEIISAFKLNREIPLDPLNTTYLPRLNDPSDVRGTSIYSRLYRTIMYEDFIVNASLAIAQRHAAPMRIFKMGSNNTDWLPTDDDIESFQELLSLAEADPLAAIVTHHDVTCELVGVSDRVLLISREWDFIERIKLLALGVAKSFLVGESSFACFEQGTKVLNSAGVPIEIENIKAGEYVLDQFGKSQKVINNWCEGTPEKLLEISTWGGNKFKVTHNHRFPVWQWPTECSCGCGQKISNVGRFFAKSHKTHKLLKSHKLHKSVKCTPQILQKRHTINEIPEGYNPSRIVEAKELRKGDFLKIPKTKETIKDFTFINKDTIRLLGYYLAEGNISYSYWKGKKGNANGIRLTFGVHEKETWVKDIQGICERLGFSCKAHQYNYHSKLKNSITVDIYPKDKAFITWIMENGGQYAYGKTLSKNIMELPNELLQELLIGYLRGDGTLKDFPSSAQKSNNGIKTLATVQFGTTSNNLAVQIGRILNILGYPVSRTTAKGKGNKRDYHISRIQGSAAIELAKNIWNETLNSTANVPCVWQDDEFIYVPIKSVVEVENDKPVYNLTVDNTHTYLICNGIATCNSAVAGLQTLMERLLSLRLRFEHDWIIDKLCTPVAEINEFYKRPESELAHRVRIKKQEDLRPILPTIKWKKELSPTQEQGLLNVWRDLKDRGLISDRTYAAGSGIDLDVERKNIQEEVDFRKKHPELFPQPQAEGGRLGGGGLSGGGGMPPPMGDGEGELPGGEEGGPESFESPLEQSPEPVSIPGSSIDLSMIDRLEDLKDMEDKVAMSDILEVLGNSGADQDIIRELKEASKYIRKTGPQGADFLSGSK